MRSCTSAEAELLIDQIEKSENRQARAETILPK